jgi:hypothetical protein
MTDEAAISQEKDIGVVILEAGKSVECNTVQRHKDGGREQQLFIKRHPVDTVIIRHASLNYLAPL